MTISDATAGTTIYYTTNGTTPTTSSTNVHRRDHGQRDGTLEAIAVETGYTNSAVATAAYTIGRGSTSYINYPSNGFTASGLSLNYGRNRNRRSAATDRRRNRRRSICLVHIRGSGAELSQPTSPSNS